MASLTAANLILLPTPRRLTATAGTHALGAGRFIFIIEGPADRAAVRRAGLIVQEALAGIGPRLELTAARGADPARLGVVLHVDPAQVPWREGYRMLVLPGQIQIVAHDAAGAFYAAMTLRQIARQIPAGAGEIPCMMIEDYPDFPNRGMMLDISRDKVPTLATLKELVALLAEWKLNQFQLYTEHTFAYRNHRQVWEKASPLSGEEILELDAWCREHFIELVPNQNSFGHFTRWLEHEPYRKLAESPDAPGCISVTSPEALDLLKEMYEELLPHFTSTQFNVGCDETFDLGKGVNKDLVETQGEGRVYLDFLLRLHKICQAQGRTMQFWGDIIMNHPELIPELPEGIVALEWGYEASQPPAEHCAKFQAAGVPFYVCPGTSSWNTLVGRTDNTRENLWRAAENGLNHGAIGFLITDWGDHGHWQGLPLSYLGLAYGAAVSWAAQANREIDLPQVLNRHVFHDAAGVMGPLVYEFGNVYRETGAEVHNSTIFWRFLIDVQKTFNTEWLPDFDAAKLAAAAEHLDRLIPRLDEAKMDRPDAVLVIDELRTNARLARHACRQAAARLAVPEGDLTQVPAETREALAQELEGLIADQRRIWLGRNREGGLTDSLDKLEKVVRAYRMQ